MATSQEPAANVQAKETAKPAATTTKTEAPAAPAAPPRPISKDERHQMIAKAAYGHAERTGFKTDPLLNWLQAEREIDAKLARLAS
ncbi:MAG: DUF2934 domain-containing protein [Minicystis sp.]